MSVSNFGFLAGMGERLGSDVDALVDRRGGIVYVGKGKGDRAAKMEGVYGWRDVSAYLPDRAQNPTRHVNC